MSKEENNNTKRILIIAIVGILGIFLMAQGSNNITGNVVKVPVTVGPSGVTVKIPQHAVEVMPGIFDLGQAVHEGKVVQGYMFIDYKKGYAKPDHAGKKGKGGSKSKCFQQFARGAKWKTTEPFLLNPANVNGMSSAFVENVMTSSINEWESQVSFDIFGTQLTTSAVLSADTVTPDGVNEVYFGGISGQGSIAVTILWGIFSGPVRGRQLVEWDMVFDDAEFRFGNAGPTSETSPGDTSLMDLQNIAAHEVGHAAGLNHPEDTCTEETMYAFADYGETKKRTLNAGDISGIQGVY